MFKYGNLKYLNFKNFVFSLFTKALSNNDFRGMSKV